MLVCERDSGRQCMGLIKNSGDVNGYFNRYTCSAYSKNIPERTETMAAR